MSLLSNLCYNSWCFIQHHHQAQNFLLIILFFMSVADILALQEFCTCHDKCEANYRWIDHFYVFMILEVARTLANISINYLSKAILSSGRSLPASTYESVIAPMNQACTLLQSGLLRHSIDSFATLPASFPYFQRSIGLIPAHKLTKKVLTTSKVLPPGETTLEAVLLAEILVMLRATIRTPTPS